MFGINPGEFAVLLLVALIVVGPERLPRYAQKLGEIVREGRKMAMGLREQVRGELGPEFDDVDWQKLDPRQYDPRKIIREALSDTLEEEPKAVSGGGPTPRKPARPGSAASPAAVAAAAATAAPKPAAGEPESSDQPTDTSADQPPGQPAVPAARTASGAPVDLEAT